MQVDMVNQWCYQNSQHIYKGVKNIINKIIKVLRYWVTKHKNVIY